MLEGSSGAAELARNCLTRVRTRVWIHRICVMPVGMAAACESSLRFQRQVPSASQLARLATWVSSRFD